MFELVIKGVPVKRGILEDHMSYVASMTFGDVARLLDDERLSIPNDPDLPDFAQRKPNTARVRAIARYILETYKEGTTFFPPICVNVQPKPIYKDGCLFLPYHSVTIRLTDGQHRCFGIRQALMDIQEEKSDYTSLISQLEIGVLMYAGLSLEHERQAFRDQNLLVQRPNVSLSHTFDQRSPKVFIAKQLLQRVPQFRDNVEMLENSLGKHNPKLVTFSTLVTATQHMFPFLKEKKDLESMIDWATTFWAATASLLPEDPWQIKNEQERANQRKLSVAVSGVVFQALGMLAHDLFQESVPASNLVNWLRKLTEIDWRRDNDLWRERGVTQIGGQGEPIIPNTKTNIHACHKILRELIGVTPLEGII
jgi:DGQHR domain-containing protein